MFQSDKLAELLDAPVSRPDPFTLEALIAWLKTQRPDETYCYVSNGECLLARYFSARGYQGVSVTSHRIYFIGGNAHIPDGWDSIALGFNGATGNHRTYSAALIRARLYAASQVTK